MYALRWTCASDDRFVASRAPALIERRHGEEADYRPWRDHSLRGTVAPLPGGEEGRPPRGATGEPRGRAAGRGAGWLAGLVPAVHRRPSRLRLRRSGRPRGDPRAGPGRGRRGPGGACRRGLPTDGRTVAASGSSPSRRGAEAGARVIRRRTGSAAATRTRSVSPTP